MYIGRALRIFDILILSTCISYERFPLVLYLLSESKVLPSRLEEVVTRFGMKVQYTETFMVDCGDKAGAKVDKVMMIKYEAT